MNPQEKVVDCECFDRSVNYACLEIVGALMANADTVSMGVSEDELFKKVGEALKKENIQAGLAHLLNRGVVIGVYCQVGTAGPFAHYYKLNKTVIHISIKIIN